jgi:Mor family transcriptional regulator
MPNKITPQLIDRYQELEKDLQAFYAQRNEEIIDLHNNGRWSIPELAEKYKLTRQRVHKIIKAAKKK